MENGIVEEEYLKVKLEHFLLGLFGLYLSFRVHYNAIELFPHFSVKNVHFPRHFSRFHPISFASCKGAGCV